MLEIGFNIKKEFIFGMEKSLKTGLFLLVLLLNQLSVLAHPEYLAIYASDKRSLPSLRDKCSVCHISSAGGGPRNQFGIAFQAAGFMITDSLVQRFPDRFKQDASSSGGTSDNSSGSNLAPSVKRVKPVSFMINVQSMLTIIGKDFVSGSKALIDNKEADTTFKSGIKLIVNFILNTAGAHEVKVRNPDGQESKSVKIKAK